MAITTKKWWKSKTLIVNALVFLGSLISGITGENWLDGELQLMILSVAEAILRKYTNTGLEK